MITDAEKYFENYTKILQKLLLKLFTKVMYVILNFFLFDKSSNK